MKAEMFGAYGVIYRQVTRGNEHNGNEADYGAMKLSIRENIC